MNKSIHIAAAVVAAGILGTAAAQPALAAPPTPVPTPDDLFLEAGIGCPDFELKVSSSGGNLHKKEFKDRNGATVRIISAGKGFDITYTNVGSGESVTVKTPGSVSKTVDNGDGTQTVSSTGHNGLILFPSDIPAGPTTTHYTGRIVYNVNLQTGVFTLVSTAGQERDICSELSD
jgi:hypothetical protein